MENKDDVTEKEVWLAAYCAALQAARNSHTCKDIADCAVKSFKESFPE